MKEETKDRILIALCGLCGACMGLSLGFGIGLR
jgi:hypothetical protein